MWRVKTTWRACERPTAPCQTPPTAKSTCTRTCTRTVPAAAARLAHRHLLPQQIEAATADAMPGGLLGLGRRRRHRLPQQLGQVHMQLGRPTRHAQGVEVEGEQRRHPQRRQNHRVFRRPRQRRAPRTWRRLMNSGLGLQRKPGSPQTHHRGLLAGRAPPAAPARRLDAETTLPLPWLLL